MTDQKTTRSSFSLLPALIFVAVLTFSVRLGDVFVFVRDQARQSAYAADAPAKAAEESDEDSHAESQASMSDHAEGDLPEGGETHEGDTAQQEDLNVWRDAVEEDFAYANARDTYVNELEDRRKLLEAREKDLRTRAALLEATEKEMERKYVELNQIRKQIEGLLDQQEEAEQKQIESLVKIYEGMKAKEAAVIFNTLDIDVLLRVLMGMSERKASAILAKMTPERAKTVTVLLAEQKSLPDIP